MKDLDKRQINVDAVHSGNIFSFKAWPHERQTHPMSRSAKRSGHLDKRSSSRPLNPNSNRKTSSEIYKLSFKLRSTHTSCHPK